MQIRQKNVRDELWMGLDFLICVITRGNLLRVITKRLAKLKKNLSREPAPLRKQRRPGDSPYCDSSGNVV